MVRSSPILLVPVKKNPNYSVIIMLFLGENKQKQTNKHQKQSTQKNPTQTPKINQSHKQQNPPKLTSPNSCKVFCLGGECLRWILRRLKICGTADWGSCICLCQWKRLGELQKWPHWLINTPGVPQKPRIHLMLFAVLGSQVSCESLDKCGFERRHCGERVTS